MNVEKHRKKFRLYMKKVRKQLQEWKEHGIPLEVWNREMAGVNREMIEMEKEIDRLKGARNKEYAVFARNGLAYRGWSLLCVERSKRKAKETAVREACVNIVEYARSARCHTDDAHVLGFLDQIERWAQAALSKPPRNCDVGTVDEQAERFHNFCVSNSSSIDGMCDPKCPFIENTDKCHCLCEWEQMPYKAEKGGAS